MWIIELQYNCASISTLWSKLCSTWRVRGHEYRAMFVNYQWGWKFLKFCEGSLSLLRYAYHILEYIECSFKTNLILVHFWQSFKWKVLTYIFFLKQQICLSIRLLTKRHLMDISDEILPLGMVALPPVD